ncbi:hypothetical protein FSP39_004221 [Pinctada imbricata]|uniref:Reverse transcriptase domain-containing protein n=1 Tax=Pinctada imbricata TaxID=66713 RepID=A0AA89BPT2_PINIB|nr:hypothetical protein FSP39_004221 [Pinctada imbricata]
MAEFLLIQEHWLFNFEIHKLNAIDDNIRGCGKAVDDRNPIPPVQKPRGYGGVGILWRKDLDHLVTAISEGNERMQCVIISMENTSILLMSVYLPTKGQSDNYVEFAECISLLGAIIEKYTDHIIIIAGDFNEDLTTDKSSRRKECLLSFVDEFLLETKYTKSTFIHPNGRDNSVIDYIFMRKSVNCKMEKVYRLDTLGTNTSDHIPVVCTIQEKCMAICSKNKESSQFARVKWKSVDIDLYQALVKDRTCDLDPNLTTMLKVDQYISNIHEILTSSAMQCADSHNLRPKRRQKLRCWTPEIKQAIKLNKEAHYMYKMKEDSGTLTQQDVVKRKQSKSHLRSLCRKENAKAQMQQRLEILEAKSEDSALFHRLVRRQRNGPKSNLCELTVNGQKLQGTENIRDGWKDHFNKLAIPTDCEKCDKVYIEHTKHDTDIIKDICISDSTPIQPAETEEISHALGMLNTGKAPDLYGVTVEHLLYAGDPMVTILTMLLNAIFSLALVPNVLKYGAITPVFKKKGSVTDARNYRGITVLPVIGKLLEILIRNRIRKILEPIQNPMQRGFTRNASPLYCALIIEEFIRESLANKDPVYSAYLDARTAFDVVNHNSLLRKLFNAGIEGKLWSIIQDFHTNAVSVVKWEGAVSSPFNIHQGVRQGGILSADLYKLYVNQLLNRLSDSALGAHIGDTVCNAPTCADDLSSISKCSTQLQSLCDIAVDYSRMEKYELQPLKSVIVPVTGKGNKKSVTQLAWTLGDKPMPIVDQTSHIGIVRVDTNKPTAHVDNNILKAQRALYSMMSSGLHGENGLDPETSVHLLRTYVIPILTYGLEIYLPGREDIKSLDTFLKRTLKHILSLPTTTADPAPYILSGVLPIEGIIHLKALSLFGSISRLDDSAIEKRIAIRQLSVKSHKSPSWFITIESVLLKYDLPSPLSILNTPLGKNRWKALTDKQVTRFWTQELQRQAATYSTLRLLSIDGLCLGKIHPILRLGTHARTDINKISTKTKLMTGTYILQSTRAAFNHVPIDPMCLLCKSEEETLHHFLIKCPAMSDVRDPLIVLINECVYSLFACDFPRLEPELQLQVIIDHRSVFRTCSLNDTMELEHLCRTLCYSLHCKRYKVMMTLPSRKRLGL